MVNIVRRKSEFTFGFFYRKMVVILLWLAIVTQISSAQGTGKGTRIDLTSRIALSAANGQFAQIFIPDYFTTPADGQFTLVFHLHSASWAAEDEVYKTGANAILFNMHIGALSSPYQNYFLDDRRFGAILEMIVEELNTRQIITGGQIKNLIFTSFSAGYAGLREILKSESYYNVIDAINLADGLHSSSSASSMQIQMADFLKFARDARDKKKIMLLTHSSITTSGYKSTTETADYLISGINAQRVPVSAGDEIGLQKSTCDTGYFHLRGYAGTTADDHMKHLYNMDMMIHSALDLIADQINYLPEVSTPSEYQLAIENYPNPFNNTTRFRFRIPETGRVVISIFDQRARKVALLLDEMRNQGEHEIGWDPVHLASGVYFYSIRLNNLQQSGRCILVK